MLENKSAIIRLFVANSVSGFAQGLSLIAIPWYFINTLQDATLMGQVYFTITFTTLFWGLYAGTLVDRFDRKKLFIAENLVGMLSLFCIAAYGYMYGGVPVVLVSAVWAITFWCFNLHYPALYAFVQEITLPQHYKRITSYLEIQGQSTSAIAGALGAFLISGLEAGDTSILGIAVHIPFSIEKWALHEVFMLDACTYVIALSLIFPIKYKAISVRFTEKLGLIKRFKVGVGFLQQYPLLLVFGIFAPFIFVTTMLLTWLLIPNFVENYLHAPGSVYSIGEMAFAVGALFSGMFIGRVFARVSTVMGCILTTCITATCFVVLIFNRQIAVFYLLMLLLGLANSGSRIMRVTYIFGHIPNQVIGRVQSVFMVINVLFRLCLIALLSFPFFVNHIEYAFGILASGCFISVAVLSTFYQSLTNLHVNTKQYEKAPVNS